MIKNQLPIAERLSGAAGIFMGVFEYGLTSRLAAEFTDQTKRSILAHVEEVSKRIRIELQK